jgi:hypothetical protein
MTVNSKVREHADAIFVDPFRILTGRTRIRPLSIMWWATFLFIVPLYSFPVCALI